MPDLPNNIVCRECRGTGVYKGLNAVEDCRACNGIGSFEGIVLTTKEKMLEMDAPFPTEAGYSDITITSDNIWVDGATITASGLKVTAWY